jgi:hypothetical protein
MQQNEKSQGSKFLTFPLILFEHVMKKTFFSFFFLQKKFLDIKPMGEGCRDVCHVQFLIEKRRKVMAFFFGGGGMTLSIVTFNTMTLKIKG